MRIDGVGVAESPRRAGWARLSATVSYEGVGAPPEVLWFEVPAAFAPALSPAGDAFVTGLAPLAAFRRESMASAAPVDSLLRENVQEVTRVWRSWYEDLRDVSVSAPQSVDPPPRGRRTASFFSGGVDSFFTALRHAAGEGTPATVRIDDLILVHGFDIPLANEAAFATVEQSLRVAADSLGKRLLVLATNIRETRFADTEWTKLSHGPALAAVAHALGRGYETVLIGSSAGYRDLRFWGSHPLTDPMFTSSRTRVLHDGPAYMRVEKTEYMARSPVALKHLRICWVSDDGRNCGRCNNCYRTMLALDALGALDACATFDRRTLDMRQAGRIFCRYDYDIRQFGYVLDLARSRGRADIAAAVERSLRGSRRLQSRLEWLRRLRGSRRFRRLAADLEHRLMRGWI